MTMAPTDEKRDNGSAMEAPSPWHDLTQSLNKIETLGEFAFMKKYRNAPNPVIRVGEEIIALPLSKRDAEFLKSVSQQAPFGKMDRTITDTTIRNTRQLDLNQFSVTNPHWEHFLQQSLETVRETLQIDEALEAQLYKLLLYEEGSFFTPHTDSQKEKNMIATLVVCLPSEHLGGDVHLSHAGQDHVLETSQSALFHTAVLAWYSDVRHEVKKVVSGYRLVLTYNIIRKSTSNLQTASPWRAAVQRELSSVRTALKKCSQIQKADQKWKIYGLDHKYSRASLSLAGLKGCDSAVCLALEILCSRLGFYLFLGHLTRKDEVSELDGEGEGDIWYTDLRLNTIVDPNGARLLKGVDICEEDLLFDLRNDRQAARKLRDYENQGNGIVLAMYAYYYTVAIICPKTYVNAFIRLDTYRRHDEMELGQVVFRRDLWRENRSEQNEFPIFHKAIVNLSNITRMILKDCEEPSNDLQALESCHETLVKIFEALDNLDSPSEYDRIMEWAWEYNYLRLFLTFALLSTRAINRGLKTAVKVIDHDLSLAQDASASRLIQIFNDQHLEVQSLTDLTRSLAILEAEMGKTSKSGFVQLRKEVELRELDRKPSLDVGDLDFILSALEQSDRGISIDHLTRTIQTRGRRSFIAMLASEIIRHNLPRDTAAVILPDRVLQIVAIIPADFESEENFVPFLDLLEQSLLADRRAVARKLLETSWSKISAYHVLSDERPLSSYKENVARFIHSLECRLRKHNVPALECTAALIKLLVCRYLYYGWPVYPGNPPGWSRDAVGCSLSCNLCQRLDKFLLDPHLTERFFKLGEDGIKHLLSRLPRGREWRSTIKYAVKKNGIRVFKANEPEWVWAKENYDIKLRKLEEPFHLLRTDYMQSLLGESSYRKIIMLEEIRGSEGSKKLSGKAT
ncbi:hypothetical protein F5Y16DRAFT_375966 [Xylariaceae sp. FL0255]|nr:hypothetical protein F5Y16DRAFT_375966 [Xylariaceae sp. FL0255]